MINIPDQVKTLLKSDRLRKNVRIHFDNNQIPDITNDSLVSESLRFRESVSSDDTVVFGTAEASVLEFEAVGIQNIFAEKFTASIELDATTLPESMQQLRDDLPYPVYPIPLGEFTVTSCPRNHDALARRKCTSMGKFSPSSLVLSDSLNNVLNIGIASTPYPSAWRAEFSLNRFLTSFGFVSGDLFQQVGTSTYTRNIRPDPLSRISTDSGFKVRLREPGSQLYSDVPIDFQAYYNSISCGSTVVAAKYTGHLLPLSDDVESLASSLLDGYNPSGNIIAPDGTTAQKQDLLRPLTDYLEQLLQDESSAGLAAIVRAYSVPSSGAGSSNAITYMAAQSGSSDEVYIPSVSLVSIPFSSKYYANNSCRVRALMSVSVYSLSRYSSDESSVWLLNEDTSTITTYSIPNDDMVSATAAVRTTKGRDGTYSADFTQAKADALDIASSAAELFGCFLARDRFGRAVAKRLSREPVARIEQSQYASCWFDEYDVEPIGAIRYTYKDEERTVIIGDGKSEYIIQSLAFFDGIIGTVEINQIEAMMIDQLAPELLNLQYVPTQLKAVNIPHVESGDMIEILLHDGNVIRTFVFERDMKGIQHMSDNVTADGITIQEIIQATLEE